MHFYKLPHKSRVILLHMKSLKAFMHLLFRGNIYQLTPPDPPLPLKIHDPPLMVKFYDPPL